MRCCESTNQKFFFPSWHICTFVFLSLLCLVPIHSPLLPLLPPLLSFPSSSPLTPFFSFLLFSPFVHDVYGSRAIAHFQMGRFRAAVSDGYRCIVLNPDGWKVHNTSISLLLLLCNNRKYCTIAKVEEVLPHHTGLLRPCMPTFSAYLSKCDVYLGVFKCHIQYRDIPLVLYAQTLPSCNTVPCPTLWS